MLLGIIPIPDVFHGERAFWRRPWFWAAVLAVAVAAAALVRREYGGGVVTAGLAVAAFFAFAGFAWALGWSQARDPVADLFISAADDSPDGRLITGPGGEFVYANSAFHRLFALAPSLDAITDVLKGTQGEEAFARLRAGAEAALPEVAEIPLAMPAGPVEWRRLSVTPIHHHRGYAFWRVEDITARREMDFARSREEKMLADFLDHLPAGFFSVDGRGRLLYVNRTLAGWLGIQAGHIGGDGHAFADFVISSERVSGAAGYDDGAGLHGYVTLRAADGDTFKASLVQSQLLGPDGAMTHSRSVVLRDLVWRGGGEAGRSPEETLHWLFDEAPVGIVLLDLSGEVTDCNRAYLKLLGIHREAVIERPFSERLSREDRGDVAAQLSKVVMGIIPAVMLDVRMPAAGEREVVASLYASRLEDHGGEVSGLALHFIDTTEQKHLEVQFAQSQKMQAVGQLAGGVAHDFNNLLTAMIGFCDLLLDRHGPNDPSFSDIMQIKQNANRATNLVRQLLAFSRKQTLKPVILAPNEAVADLYNLLGRLIGENIELNMEPGGDLGLIRVDQGQFDQVIINLAVNSRDAMPGGGTLTIRTANAAIDEPVQRGHELMPAGDYVLIEVMDTGVGIAKENIDRIFEPFFSTKEVGAGTGLGLSTVYGIVHQTDGFVFCDSAPGEGTTFGIYLPRYEGIAPERDENGEVIAPPLPGEGPGPAAPAPESDLTGAGTVLLVEDEDAVRMFGARALRNKGYRVLEAVNGEAALDVINSTDEAINLIISDVVMPGMDGHTLVKLVRQEMPDVKLILMSGYAEDVFAEDIGADRSIHFLPKPFSLKQLAGTVKQVMGG